MYHREAWPKTGKAYGLCSEELLDSKHCRNAAYYIGFVTAFFGLYNTFRDKTWNLDSTASYHILYNSLVTIHPSFLRLIR